MSDPASVRPANPLTFAEFVAKVAPKYLWYRHCRVLGDVLQQVAEGQIKRLMIFEPPRHGKSEETSRLFSAYFLYRYPDRWVAVSSYAAGLAFSLSRTAKYYYVAADGTLKSDAKAVKHWETGKGGGFWACGVGGEATGKGFHLGICDDPIKNAEQAQSVTIREKHKEWWSSVWYTREEPWSEDDPNGAIIVIQTRWNEDDLSGWLLAEEATAARELQEEIDADVPADQVDDWTERWHIVCLPAIAEEPERDAEGNPVTGFPPTCTVEPDWRAPGEALCPERRPLRKLQRLCRQIGEYFWSALFQQRPRPKLGNAFLRCWFEDNLIDAAPLDADYIRFWDKAGSAKKRACYTCGALLCRCRNTGRFYVVDVVRGRWDTADREEKMRSVAMQDRANYGNGVRIAMEQEPGSSGLDSARASVINLAGFSATFATSSGDKEVRFEPFAAQAKVGNVGFVRSTGRANDWNHDYIEELVGLWTGHYKDQADATSGSFNLLALGATMATAEPSRQVEERLAGAFTSLASDHEAPPAPGMIHPGAFGTDEAGNFVPPPPPRR